MPRILGVDIPNNKQTVISLQYIYGIGPAIAKAICVKAKLDPVRKASELSQDDISNILNVLHEDYTVEGDLRRQVANNIRRLIAIGSYRGTHPRGLQEDRRRNPRPDRAQDCRLGGGGQAGNCGEEEVAQRTQRRPPALLHLAEEFINHLCQNL